MKKYIGIDNGVNGGIVILDIDMKIISSIVMPVFGSSKKDYDVKSILALLEKHKEDSIAILERAQPRYRDGSKQAFKTGYGFGILEGILSSLRIPFQVALPKVWQKEVLKGLNTDDTKIASIMFCKRRWPEHSWKATERCIKDHDGLTDACCMAYYGYMLQNGK